MSRTSIHRLKYIEELCKEETWILNKNQVPYQLVFTIDDEEIIYILPPLYQKLEEDSPGSFPSCLTDGSNLLLLIMKSGAFGMATFEDHQIVNRKLVRRYMVRKSQENLRSSIWNKKANPALDRESDCSKPKNSS